jgi:hypothetical protein
VLHSSQTRVAFSPSCNSAARCSGAPRGRQTARGFPLVLGKHALGARMKGALCWVTDFADLTDRCRLCSANDRLQLPPILTRRAPAGPFLEVPASGCQQASADEARSARTSFAFNALCSAGYVKPLPGSAGHCPKNSNWPPAAIQAIPAARATHRPKGVSFSKSTSSARSAIQSTFITPPTNKSAIRTQQHPTQ